MSQASPTTSSDPLAAGAQQHTVFRSLGLGLVTGAADDDCSAVGTYAQAGAQFGYRILWTAPVTFPMMVTVVYLSGKLGQVTGQGLFAVLRSHAPRTLLYLILAGVIFGNVIEAGADIGGMAAAAGLFLHIPGWTLIAAIALISFVFQVWGSYTTVRNVFRVLALTLLAYVGSALLSHPRLSATVQGTLVPHLRLDRNLLAILVAIIGTSLSAYLYTWQSNEEVEEKVAAGKRSLAQRRGTTEPALRTSFWDVLFGMLFSSVVMYFIMLATASTLFSQGQHTIDTAADAARALEPLAGRAASVLFAAGIIGVGFLAIPVMTTGAAYDVCQSWGWVNGLHYKPAKARKFYAAIAVFTMAAMALNFFGINPMRALVWAGIVQGFSTPPLLLLIMILTNRRSIMGDKVNGRWINLAGWTTTAVISAASVSLLYTFIRR